MTSNTQHRCREREALLEEIRLAEAELAAGKGVPHEVAKRQLLERLSRQRSPK